MALCPSRERLRKWEKGNKVGGGLQTKPKRALVCTLEEQTLLNILKEQSMEETGKLTGKRVVLRLEQQLIGRVLWAKPLFVFWGWDRKQALQWATPPEPVCSSMHKHACTCKHGEWSAISKYKIAQTHIFKTRATPPKLMEKRYKSIPVLEIKKERKI